MPRLRLYDVRSSRLMQAVGVCQGDITGMAALASSAQSRLVMAKEAGDTGWWGSWARTVFNVAKSDPYITLPRSIARITDVTVCNHPIRIQNEFYEFLEFGIGRQDPNLRRFPHGLEMYDRGVYPTFVDLTKTSIIRVYPTSGNDGGARTIINGLDGSGQKIYSQDGYNQVEGLFVQPVAPFVDMPVQVSKITSVQKDVTTENFLYYAVDPTTGDETPILTMEPSEEVSGYRRYFIGGLPRNCCNGQTTTQVEGMAKLEVLPVTTDTDYFVIQNLEAIIAECKAIRYGDMDSPAAKTMAAQHHTEAIRLLQGELIHYLGKQMPAVVFAPFGSARLSRVKIGMQ